MLDIMHFLRSETAPCSALYIFVLKHLRFLEMWKFTLGLSRLCLWWWVICSFYKIFRFILFIQIYDHNSFYLSFYMFQIFPVSWMMNQRTDCNRGVGQPPTSCTNSNSLNPLLRNGDVSSEVEEFVGDPPTSAEVLETACGIGVYKMFKIVLQKLVFYLNIFLNQAIIK